MFELEKRLIFHGNEKRVGAPVVAVKCAVQDSGDLQLQLTRAQNDGMFECIMVYNPHGMIHRIGQEKYKNILRRQNQYIHEQRVIPLFEVDKPC